MNRIARGRPLRVLAVDDDDDLRAFYGAILAEEGYEVRLARNGLDALAQLNWKPDLILLDLMMPVMDGYEFMRELRVLEHGTNIPVLVLSAALPPGRDTIRGAQAVVRKPFDFDRLLRAIDMYGNRPQSPLN